MFRDRQFALLKQQLPTSGQVKNYVLGDQENED